MPSIEVESDADFARQMFVDFDEELMYWRDRYRSCRFYRIGMTFGDYEPAFKLGINVFLRSHGRSFDELKDQLRESYERTRGATPLEWPEASVAAGAAWQRMSEKQTLRTNHNASRDRRGSARRPGTRPTNHPGPP